MTNGKAAMSGPARAIAALKTTAEFKPGWYAPKVFSHPVFMPAIAIMLIHSSITGALLLLYGKHIIDIRIKNLYAISLFITLQGSALVLLGKFTVKRGLTVIATMILAVLWEFIFVKNYKALSPMFFINAASIIYWTIFDPEITRMFGIRREKLGRDLLIGGAISVVFFAYILYGMHMFGFELKFDFWKNLKHSAIASGQTLIVTTFVFAIWNHINKGGLSESASIILLAIFFLALEIPLISGSTIGNGFGLFNGVSAMLATTLMFTIAGHISFRLLGNVFPVVFTMTLLHEALLMAGKL